MANGDDIGQLISRVGLKDRGAFRELYQRTSGKLFGITLRVLGNRNDAEDALQEIYVKIWNKADGFSKGRSSGIAWLSVIARNQAIDLLRSRKGGEDIDDHHDLSDDKPSPEMVTLSNENALRLEECLDGLEDVKGKMIRDIYLGGWSYQQAADVLEVPLNTAKTWIRRSLMALRECMDR